MHDPIADNVPAGAGADVGSLAVTVDGEDAGAVPLTRLPEGDAALPDPSFWVQHPHKEVIDTESGWAEAQIPLTEGTHIVRLETAKNAADNTGFAEVAVTLTKQEIPGAGDPTTDPDGNAILTMNLFIPEDTTSAAVDTAVFYWGERDPILPPTDPADPQLTESLDALASLVFSLELSDTTTQTVTIREVYDGTAWVTPANGVVALDDTTIEKLKADVVYTFADGGAMRFTDLELEETAAGSRVFRGGVGVEEGGDEYDENNATWREKLHLRPSTPAGVYYPITVRAKGLPSRENTSFSLAGMQFDFEAKGDWVYPKGNSIVMTRNGNIRSDSTTYYWEVPYEDALARPEYPFIQADGDALKQR